MADKQICISIYPTPEMADEAFSRLSGEGFNMNLLSIAGRDYWADMAGSEHSWRRQGEGGFSYCGNLGAFWDRLWAKLPGGGVFCFFENGPMLVAGRLSQAIMAKPAKPGNGARNNNGDGHLNGFAAALSGIGIKEQDVAEYQMALMNNQILLFVYGDAVEVDHAQRLLNETKAINHTIHHTAADFEDPADSLELADRMNLTKV